MPLETFIGPHLPSLLAQAEAVLGPDAVVVAVRPAPDGGRRLELVAADPASAGRRELARSRPDPVAGPSSSLCRTAGPLVIALVGPTGAGKTTTIAKLATHPEAFGRRRVGLLCLDTYRIGAVEQSRVYAELGGFPLEVAYEPSDLEAAMHRLRGCDVVLVDTAGRGPRSAADQEATQSFLRRLGPTEVHLVLPAGLEPSLARRLATEGRTRGATHLLLTKLDEFPDGVSMFRLAVELGLPARWFTNGQEVPFDLRPAGPFLRQGGRRVARQPAGAGAS
jgi:flagellar biosynthesis protein FlhF